MIGCYFCPGRAVAMVQVDPDDPSDKRGACRPCVERIGTLHRKYVVTPLQVEAPDPED